jgi:Niemann-Pick C1 protein
MAWYAHQLMRPLVKVMVVIVFLYFFGLCIYRTTLLTQEFDATELFPEGSYVTDVLDAMTVYQERALQVEIYFRDVNQSDPAVQQQMLDFVNEIEELPAFGASPPLCWVRDFQLIRETEYFDLVRNSTFEEQVDFALSIPAIREAYGLDIVHENGTISASRCQIMMKNSVTEVVQDQIDVLLNQRALTNEQPINQGRAREAFFTFNQIYLLWEFYNIAVQELITTTVASVVAVSVVALFFIPHWSALLFIVPMISIVYIDLLGKKSMCGFDSGHVTVLLAMLTLGTNSSPFRTFRDDGGSRSSHQCGDICLPRDKYWSDCGFPYAYPLAIQ